MFVFPRQLIIWTFVMIACLGGIEALNFMQPMPSEKQTYHSANYLRAKRSQQSEAVAQDLAIIKDQAMLPTTARAPASKDETDFSAIPLDERNSQQAVDLTLGCKGAQSSAFAKGVTQVRLSGTSCNKREILSSEIYNEANGTSATVFFPTPMAFMTDYINLVPGPNKIHIMHNYKKAPQETRDYVITRAAQTKKI